MRGAVGRLVDRTFGRIPHPPMRSRRGLLILFVLVAGLGSAVTVGSVVAIQWTETADFCGRCHAMGPELKAYAMSPHRDVPCVDCHTEPGIEGWIKAKLTGTKQLIQVLTGTFPKPIPAPDHADLPPTSATCLRCHDPGPLLANGGPIKLVLQNRYRSDAANTRDSIALVVRPFGFGAPGTTTTSGLLRGSAATGGSTETDGGTGVDGQAGPAEPPGSTGPSGSAGPDGSTAAGGSDDPAAPARALSGPTGVHWHIGSDVDYVAEDAQAQKIDYVEIVEPNGQREEFIAANAVSVSSNVQPDIDRLRAKAPHRMDCIDCHNRVGHGIPSLDTAIDDRIDAGEISTDLPYIKREAVSRLSIDYASTDDADRAIDALRAFYGQQYPLVAKQKAAEINEAISTLKTVYALVATPDMRVTAATYPDNLGHQSSPGCFRCHDGAHYRVVNGALTSETIPSTCATCHTFPQIGSIESGVLIGQRPATHNDRLWVFDHKSSVTSADPTNQSCGACHTRTYCENCHRSAAVNVSHDSMVTNHAEVTKEVGAAACAYCHQPAYCAQCHANDVLPAGPSNQGPPGDIIVGDRPPPSPSPP